MKSITDLFREINNQNVLLEMANIRAEEHRLGVNVMIHTFKEHVDQQLPHGPRVKVYSKVGENQFNITISDNPKVIKSKSFLNAKDLSKILFGIKKYKIPLLNFWYDISYVKYDMLSDMRMVDEGNGDDVEIRY